MNARLNAALESAHRLADASAVPFNVFEVYRRGLGWRWRTDFEPPANSGEWFTVDREGRATCSHRLFESSAASTTPFAWAWAGVQH